MKYTATLNGKQYEVELERIDAYEPMPRYGEAPAAAPAPIAAPVAAPAEPTVDEGELVAAITAAICAYTGSSSDGFVVRSIRRADSATWKRV